MQNMNREEDSTIVIGASPPIRKKIELKTDYATPLNKWQNIVVKRFFDILFSLVFLLCLFPVVYIVLGVAIKLSSSGTVLFVQKRTGRRGEIFRCYKFRSMRINEDTKPAIENDPRTTRVGRFLRRTNLDELPQFINVLKGEMSVVGPRPHALWTDDEYAPVISDYMLRYTVKPGITGWAQITGCRGETKRTEEMERRVSKDLWYLRNWTFALDISIILRTILSMFRGDRKAY
jgi:putative colanic acid biosynthesis UDP-glucose lipid carrier transferase